MSLDNSRILFSHLNKVSLNTLCYVINANIVCNIKGEMSDSFTNHNHVGNTKVSVSIKKTYMPTNAH